MHDFRISKKPERTCKKKYDHYRSYKRYLIEDFNGRCGYCDIWDSLLGGTDCYHIDHFAPKSKFGELELEYSNLIYSCRHCNLAKGNDWVTADSSISHDGKIGYIDPCDTQYDKLFYRADTGEIKCHIPTGEYMYDKLKFYLARHKVLWNLTRLHILCNKLESMVNDDPAIRPKHRIELNERYNELLRYLHKYLRLYLGEYR